MEIKFEHIDNIGTTRCLIHDEVIYVGTIACLDCRWFKKIDIDNQIVTCMSKPPRIWKAIKRYLNI